jgi:phosphoglucosamine mutase
MNKPVAIPRFGTDGLRGQAGQPPMDAATLRRVGAALGIWLSRSGPADKRVVLGNDGRASAPWILTALAEGLTATDVAVVDLGLTTTPALAFTARTQPFVAGIMISASHNPAADNGIKIFDGTGAKLADDAERAIEQLTLEADVATHRSPRVKRRPELLARYEEYLGNAFPNLDLSGVVIAVDAANGGGSHLAPQVLRRFGAQTAAIACQPSGFNINDGVGALHPEALAAAVRDAGAAFGICLDGDGDRGIFVDQAGNVRDGDEVLAVLAPHLKARGALRGDTVVATVMSNLGLRKSLARHGIAQHTTAVGDRAVVQAMRDLGFSLGGEQSGHIVFGNAGDLNYTGDGLVTALRLLALPGFLELGSAAAFAGFQRFPQRLQNVPVKRKPDLSTLDEVQAAVARVERELAADGRVVLRYSGTENLCRVMVEGPEAEQVERHVADIVAAVQRCLG